jgi:chromosome segregation ATPase
LLAVIRRQKEIRLCKESTTVEAAQETVEEIGSDETALTIAEREHYERIKDLNTEVHEASYKHDLAKSKAKMAKEHLESLQAELSSLISEGAKVPDPQKELPFADAEADAWKATPIADALKVTPKQLEKLEAAGVKTIGEFEHLRSGQNPDYPNGLRSIKGFGDATIDAMENDVVEWLSKNLKGVEDRGND